LEGLAVSEAKSAQSMTRVLVTGAAGMLGFHLRCRLHVLAGVEVRSAGRAEFADPAAMDALLSEVDAVVHFAGVNRGSDTEVEDGNLALAQTLAAALKRSGGQPQVLYSSSTHITRDTPYGRSKKGAGEILGAQCGEQLTELVLPHVFGEYGRPKYNSVVHTFCEQLAKGQVLSVDQVDGQLELCHAGAVCEAVLHLLKLDAQASLGEHAWQDGRLRLFGTAITVGELAELLQTQAQQYFEARELPELANSLELALFNTLRGAAFPQSYPVALKLHVDPRGSLFEAVRSHRSGQTFFSTTKPGIMRGNHFHFNKVERFLVVGGYAEIRIRRLFDDQVHVFRVSGETPAYVDMPTLHTHEITNVGDGELLTLFWAHEFFDPATPDTYAELVQTEASTPVNS
jgi:UDP-2-acetamido-2,6-beta-L-arabino-hexul-4-ose reductase